MQAGIRQRCLFAVGALGLVVVLAGTTLAQSSNSTIGTWKVNLAKSQYDAGMAPKSATFTVEAAGADFKVVVDSVAAAGTAAHWSFTQNYDGKDHHITGNCPYGDVVASTRVDANTTKNTYKRAGTVTVSQTHAVSSDGKTDTITNTSTTADGKTVSTVRVYDKQ